MPEDPRVVDVPELRNRIEVFRDRAHAGEVLAELLADYRGSNAVVAAIPAGGVPVGAEIARRLELPLELAVVSKITPPWNPEVGYGALAWDGTVRVDERLAWELGLRERGIQEGIRATEQKVERRLRKLRGERPFPDLRERSAILVDDGLASGMTLRVAIEALRKAGTGSILVAVPTGSRTSVHALAREVERIYCANLRSGYPFAVADAYERWTDVSEEELIQILAAYSA